VSDTILRRVLDGKSLPRGIGQKIRDIIIEYVSTGSVKELAELERDPKIMALERFEQVIGIGPVNALKFVLRGYTSLTELTKADDLTTMQKIGIEYFDKIMVRVPRKIVESVFTAVKQLLINDIDDIIVTGSYRRGTLTSGDVDILVKSDTMEAKSLLNYLAIDDDHRHTNIVVLSAGPQKVSFLWKLSDSTFYVQVDIFVSKSDEYIAHLNYSTGSADHNIMMRTEAIKRGYKLSQHGLYNGTTKIKLSSEQELYKLLGVPFVEPEYR
jgi:DNA polymerase/3'-5' exonuclease PolX